MQPSQDLEAAAPPPTSAPEKKIIRQDIQLIRALAVIFVFLYHLELPFLRGGFIGVDIFLVVSGYLVVGSMLERQRQGNFDVAQFVIQRIKRLTIPSFAGLIFILLLLKVVATYYLSVFPVAGFKEAGMASLHVANIHFLWSSAEYFQPDSAKSFVLHYWSLGLEEQFYVVICLLALAFTKIVSSGCERKPSRTSQLIFVVALWASSFLYFWLVDGSRRFYTVQSRTWEFLTGALIHLLEQPVSGLVQKIPKILNIVITFAVVGGLVYFGVRPSAEAYPNITTIFVVLLTSVLLIKPFVPEPKMLFLPLLYIGDWSYSIYLFHWPIIKFMQIVGTVSTLFDYCAAIAMTLVISVFSYYFIEKKSQTLQLSTKQWMVVFFFGSTLIAGAAYYEQTNVSYLRLQVQYGVLDSTHQGMLTNGTQNHDEIWGGAGTTPIDKPQLKKNLDALETQLGWFVPKGLELEFGYDRCIVAAGDSKMRQWWPTYHRLARAMNASLFDATHPGSSIRMGSIQPLLEKCKKVLALLSRDTVRPITHGLGADPITRALEIRSQATTMSTWPGYCVITFADTPYLNRTETLPRACLVEHITKDGPLEACHSFTNTSKSHFDQLMGNVTKAVRFVSMTDLFCDDVYCFANHGNYPLYIENHHVSSFANTAFNDEWLSRMKRSNCYREWAK